MSIVSRLEESVLVTNVKTLFQHINKRTFGVHPIGFASDLVEKKIVVSFLLLISESRSKIAFSTASSHSETFSIRICTRTSEAKHSQSVFSSVQ